VVFFTKPSDIKRFTIILVMHFRDPTTYLARPSLNVAPFKSAPRNTLIATLKNEKAHCITLELEGEVV